MTSLLVNPWSNPEAWIDAFRVAAPDFTIETWPDVRDPAGLDYAAVWRIPRTAIADFPNLKAILSLGAGVEQFQKPEYEGIPIVRLADSAAANEMTAYALHWVLHHQRPFAQTFGQQSAHDWTQPSYIPASRYPIAILGFGTIGSRIGAAFRSLGFPVRAWSRSGGQSNDDGLTHFAGDDQLPACLADAKAVVNVLPHSVSTIDLFSTKLFGAMERGVLFVNIGRGSAVDEPALLHAIDQGQVGHAVLDVQKAEPLPADDPLWDYPGVTVTPHIAGNIQPADAAELIVDNIRRIEAGDAPFPLYDPVRGY